MSGAAAANHSLIGEKGGLDRLATPALVLDLDAFDANLTAMARWCKVGGVALRPHAKTHKSRVLLRAQLAAGAIGVCCAKLGEGEALAPDARDVLLTSPILSDAVPRLRALRAGGTRVAVVMDDEREITALAAAGWDEPLNVFVDLDVGHHRTGVPVAEAEPVVDAVLAGAPDLRFAGLQAYAGHLQHIRDAGVRQREVDTVWSQVAALQDCLARRGIEVPVITGGGTGTAAFDLAAGVLTELQAGSYLFMDRQYGAVEPAAGSPHFRQSLFVHTRAVSCRQKLHITTDAGFKSLATDGPLPRIHSGAPADAHYIFQGDEQGAVVLSADLSTADLVGDQAMLALSRAVSAMNADADAPAPARLFRPGHLFTLTVPHCDPTVNLYDVIHLSRGDRLVDIVPVDARGRAQ